MSELGLLTSCLGAALTSCARSNSRTALAVILTSLQWLGNLWLREVVDRSEAGSQVGEESTSFKILWVQSDDRGKTMAVVGSVSAGKRGNSRNCGEGSRKVHLE
jgi:hypothetical protein